MHRTHPTLLIGRAALSTLFLSAWLGACAGSQQANPAGEPKTVEPAASAKGEPCGRLAFRLCTELGERSEGCRALRGTLMYMSPAACEAGLGDIEFALGRIEELRADCTAVAERLCTDTGAESATCESAKRDLPRVPPGHCAALLANYSQVLQAQLEREAALRPLDAEGQEALVQGEPPSFGPPTARVQVVEFSDFQCPYCAQAAETVTAIKKKYADRVLFVFRHYPLPFHEHAKLASQASMAAHRQGKFWDYHDLLFDNQGALERDDLVAYAEKVGLDMKVFQDDIEAAEVQQAVEADLQLGDRVHVNGTPTMFINGTRVENPLDFDAVSAQLDAALADQ